MIAGIVAPDIMIYTDGSVTASPIVTSCVFYIPAPDTSGSWRLTNGSSIFSAEIHGIKQALSTIYNYDHPPPGIHIFSDSSAAIKAIIST
jgi:ribonuclease HI